MKDDYLWDGSGEPDPEVQKLESRPNDISFCAFHFN